MSDEKTAWKDLRDSEGWRLLTDHVTAEWHGAPFARLVESLADKPDDLEALHKLRQVLAAKKAVERLLQVPDEQIGKLTRQDEAAKTPMMGRRGAL